MKDKKQMELPVLSNVNGKKPTSPQDSTDVRKADRFSTRDHSHTGPKAASEADVSIYEAIRDNYFRK